MTPVKLSDAERSSLVEMALEAHSRAYAPYSKFAVGAALRAASGRIHSGCNVENVAYAMTSCAERVAVGSAVCAGDREFDVIAIASLGGGSPCGGCRQVLAEFSTSLLVLLVDIESATVRATTIGALLPMRFVGAPESASE